MSIDTKRYIMGAGRVYLSESGAPPYFYVAETPTFNLSIASESVQLMSSDDVVSTQLCEVQTTQSITGQLVTNNISQRHISMFLGGEISSSNAAGGTAATFNIDPIATGVWYQLGYSSNFDGHMHVSDVTAEEDNSGGAPVALVEGTDYILEPESGLIMFPGTTKATAGDNVTVTYDWAAGTDSIISVTAPKAPTFCLVFDSKNRGCSTDLNNRIIIPNVRLMPSGDFALKSNSDYQTLTWDLAVMQPKLVGQDTIRVIQRLAT